MPLLKNERQHLKENKKMGANESIDEVKYTSSMLSFFMCVHYL